MRTSIEIGAYTVLAVVVLGFLAVVLHAGRGDSAPPRSTIVVSQTEDFATTDPALAQGQQAWELEYATCAKLLTYPAKAGYAGTRLVPEVATSLPTISADRLLYTFTIRRGWRFSDGTAVTAASFARALERARSPQLVSPASAYLREVESWQAKGRTLTIRLRTAAPDFVQRLALPYFCAVPASTPNEQTDDLPSAGPYAIAQYTRGRTLLLDRNPYYEGSRQAHAKSILYRFGAFPSQIKLQLERGEADYGVVSPVAFESLAAKFRGDRRHRFVVRQPTVAYLALNTQRPMFKNNPQLRRAINYALDRPALVRLFGTHGARAGDEYLPPGFPGYRAQHV
ncbi:MAG: peptide/nickel transport system substrate-binding protein, partial [Gaiellaceae bacterium]|nr:peptide/nickel transport system substrate-binding protein [Gaiellaceae bacterium]